MTKVKVWNDNEHPFHQNFKGYDVDIPAHKHIMMEYGEAILFRGAYMPIQYDAMGSPTPQSYKMIRVEVPDKEPPRQQRIELLCQACGYEGLSQWDLEGHIKANHGQIQMKDDTPRAAAKRPSKLKRSLEEE